MGNNLSKKNENEKIKILGFDLGHGETAVTIIEGVINSKGVYNEEKGPKHPKPVFKPESQPTALVKLGNRFAWGKNAINYAANPNNNVYELEICFKSKTENEHIANFATAVINELKMQHKEEKFETFIGCPSGWTDNDMETYRKIFDNIVKNPTIVKESQAAFTHHYEVSNGGTKYTNEVLNKILVLDFGSSTLDATFIHKEENTVLTGNDQGWPLGAAFIEKALLYWNLKNSKYDDKKIDDIIRRKKAELDTREYKELFFKEKYKEPYAIIHDKYGQIPIKIDNDLMCTLLEKPLEEIVPRWSNMDHEIQDELSGYSWMEYCEKCLKQICNMLKEKEMKQKDDVGIVLLTGGASLMKPVQEMVQNFFKKWIVVQDEKPFLAISYGLARWGRIDIKTRNLNKGIDGFLKGKGETLIIEIINNHYDRLARWFKNSFKDKNKIHKKFEQEIRNKFNSKLSNICEEHDFPPVRFLPKDLFSEEDYNQLSQDYKNLSEEKKQKEIVESIVKKLQYNIKQHKYFVKILA